MENFFESYKYTFSALGAVGTLLAVIISLYFGYRAIRSNDTRIKAYLDTSSIYVKGEKKESYITVTITNTGLFPVRIPFGFFNIISYLIKGNFKRSMINPLDAFNVDALIKQKNYPLKIEPRHREDFFIDKKDNFINTSFPKILSDNKSNSRFDLISKLPISLFNYCMTMKVLTDDGKYFKVKISKNLSKELKKVVIREVR